MAIGIHVLLAFDFEITALLCSVYTLLKRKLGPERPWQIMSCPVLFRLRQRGILEIVMVICILLG